MMKGDLSLKYDRFCDDVRLLLQWRSASALKGSIRRPGSIDSANEEVGGKARIAYASSVLTSKGIFYLIGSQSLVDDAVTRKRKNTQDRGGSDA